MHDDASGGSPPGGRPAVRAAGAGPGTSPAPAAVGRRPGRAPRLTAGGAALLAAGPPAPVVPVNKRLWSPSFVLVTSGIALLVLAVLHWSVDSRGPVPPFRPFEVLGLNTFVAFVFSEVVFRAVLSHRVQPAVDAWVSSAAGPVTSAWLYAVLSVAVVWAVCGALARRGVVVRI